MSYTEKVKLEINTLCNSVSPYLRVENTFETTSFSHFETGVMSFVLLQAFDNYISAHIAMGRLEEDGIKCWLKDENTVTIDPILTNAIGGIKLMVAKEEAERAAGILRRLDNEHKALHPCPTCGSLNIELVSTPRKASNWFSALWGFLTFSVAMPVDKVYHCFDCGREYEIEELPEKDPQ